MRLRTLGGFAVIAAVLYAVLTYGIPAFHQSGGNNDPHLVSLRVVWPGRNKVVVVWHVSAAGGKTVGEDTAVADGGVWHADVTLPGPGRFEVVLVGSPAAIVVHAPDGDFKKSTVSTCTVTSINGVVKNVAPAVVGQGCTVHTYVVVPA
jgi:hypothetical protein